MLEENAFRDGDADRHDLICVLDLFDNLTGILNKPWISHTLANI